MKPFSADPVARQLAGRFLKGSTEAERIRWAGPLPLSSRIALLIRYGATKDDTFQICQAWDVWRTNGQEGVRCQKTH